MRRRGLHLAIVAAAVMVFLSACKPQVPPEYLQPDEMEDLMYDYYVSQGISNSRAGTTDYDRRYNMQTVLKKYGLTNDDFDSTLVYYYNHMELMNEIYSRIQKRLGDEAILLGASEGEVERFTTQSVSGDTTDVWEGKRNLLLYPQAPFHIYQFRQRADSSYHAGDSFLFAYGSTFLVQSGSRNAQVYLSFTYDNDTIITRNYAVPASGKGVVRVPEEDHALKELRGYIIMNRRDQHMENDVCMLFLDNIHMLRIRKKNH
jgi:hypothetical protein